MRPLRSVSTPQSQIDLLLARHAKQLEKSLFTAAVSQSKHLLLQARELAFTFKSPAKEDALAKINQKTAELLRLYIKHLFNGFSYPITDKHQKLWDFSQQQSSIFKDAQDIDDETQLFFETIRNYQQLLVNGQIGLLEAFVGIHRWVSRLTRDKLPTHYMALEEECPISLLSALNGAKPTEKNRLYLEKDKKGHLHYKILGDNNKVYDDTINLDKLSGITQDQFAGLNNDDITSFEGIKANILAITLERGHTSPTLNELKVKLNHIIEQYRQETAGKLLKDIALQINIKTLPEPDFEFSSVCNKVEPRLLPLVEQRPDYRTIIAILNIVKNPNSRYSQFDQLNAQLNALTDIEIKTHFSKFLITLQKDCLKKYVQSIQTMTHSVLQHQPLIFVETKDYFKYLTEQDDFIIAQAILKNLSQATTLQDTMESCVTNCRKLKESALRQNLDQLIKDAAHKKLCSLFSNNYGVDPLQGISQLRDSIKNHPCLLPIATIQSKIVELLDHLLNASTPTICLSNNYIIYVETEINKMEEGDLKTCLLNIIREFKSIVDKTIDGFSEKISAFDPDPNALIALKHNLTQSVNSNYPYIRHDPSVILAIEVIDCLINRNVPAFHKLTTTNFIKHAANLIDKMQNPTLKAAVKKMAMATFPNEEGWKEMQAGDALLQYSLTFFVTPHRNEPETDRTLSPRSSITSAPPIVDVEELTLLTPTTQIELCNETKALYDAVKLKLRTALVECEREVLLFFCCPVPLWYLATGIERIDKVLDRWRLPTGVKEIESALTNINDEINTPQQAHQLLSELRRIIETRKEVGRSYRFFRHRSKKTSQFYQDCDRLLQPIEDKIRAAQPF